MYVHAMGRLGVSRGSLSCVSTGAYIRVVTVMPTQAQGKLVRAQDIKWLCGPLYIFSVSLPKPHPYCWGGARPPNRTWDEFLPHTSRAEDGRKLYSRLRLTIAL
ncbi:hypothetical protein HAX54_047052 [Datura stramonium]|uniref:Uncharacterized protein n=1 Tax=Datura stramonium TaxID=4076 RepID=A0ABS8WLH1_DATST|nr:hypothetical protein [Datura stramonium]